MSRDFRYRTGEIIRLNDIVTLSGDDGHIEAILMPGTKDAGDYGCMSTGGILVDSPKGLGFVVITEPENDEDLLRRAENPSESK